MEQRFSLMTPKHAIQKLKNRLIAYSNKHSANYDYIKDTTDIVNAIIDLYNENESNKNRFRLMEAKLKKLAEFVGFNPALIEVDNLLIDFYNQSVPVPNVFMYVLGNLDDAIDTAEMYKEHLLLADHRQIMMTVELEVKMRSMLHINGMEELLSVPTSIPDNMLYEYVMTHKYGKITVTKEERGVE